LGYQIEFGGSPEMFTAVWPLFQSLAVRKDFRFRPLASYLELMQLARPHESARIYTAYLEKRLVQAILIVRDGTTAYYISGALDHEALQGQESPSCLLHWRAMRDFFDLGVQYYHLGSKSIYEFKRQFRPQERTNLPPLTLV